MNRTDLQNVAERAGKKLAVKTPPSSQYGEATRLRKAQKDMPMAQAPTDSIGQVNAQRPRPGQLGPLTRATDFPDQPITAGADFGDGPNSLQAGVPLMDDQEIAINELINIARLYPNTGLGDLIDKYGFR
jgi:hypothetical protein